MLGQVGRRDDLRQVNLAVIKRTFRGFVSLLGGLGAGVALVFHVLKIKSEAGLQMDVELVLREARAKGVRPQAAATKNVAHEQRPLPWWVCLPLVGVGVVRPAFPGERLRPLRPNRFARIVVESGIQTNRNCQIRGDNRLRLGD